MAVLQLVFCACAVLFQVPFSSSQTYVGEQGQLYVTRIGCEAQCFPPARVCVEYEGGNIFENWQCISDCGEPPSPENGEVQTLDGTTFEELATYTCNANFILVDGPSTRTCLSTSVWSGAEPSCQPAVVSETCRNLTPPLNGQVIINSIDPETATATYSCSAGYSLIADRPNRTCTDGIWEGYPAPANEPCCEPVTCPELTAPGNGQIVYSDFLKYNSVAAYTCNTCYMMSGGNENRTCQDNGTWSGSAPNCTIINEGYDMAFGDSCYFFEYNSTTISWDDALAQCQNASTPAHLVEIQTAQEDCFLFATLKGVNADNDYLWIGGTDKLMEGTFVWESTMTPIGPYLNWKNGQPEDMNQEEDCMALIMTNYQWADRPCSSNYGYICEYEQNLVTVS